MAEVWTGAESLIFDAATGKKAAQQSADDAVNVMKENIKEKYVK
jgi:arabinogalactan oligomer/maltooligosaccharide transport system substrate-binding protein